MILTILIRRFRIATNEGIFKPLVKLGGHNADGIYFDCWQQFQDHMDS